MEALIDLVTSMELKLWPKNPVYPQIRKLQKIHWVSHWRHFS